LAAAFPPKAQTAAIADAVVEAFDDDPDGIEQAIEPETEDPWQEIRIKPHAK
jgi:hypothetical protein